MEKEKLMTIISQVFNTLDGNHFGALGMPEIPIWDAPLVGIAAGDDPYFDFLKKHIGQFHWTPLEMFQLKYGKVKGERKAHPKDLRVVSMVFPQVKQTREAQRKATTCPSREWIVSRGEWEPLIGKFSRRLVEALEEDGIRAVSTDLQPEFSWEISPNLGKASTWSHRHGAFAAGLGTFGLSEGLITERGKALRITTMVVEAPLEVTPRPYIKHNEWCLYFQDGSCGACIKRCPIHAITKDGHDKQACGAYEDELQELQQEDIDTSNYIFGCGLCQVAIPCENQKPQV